MESDISVRMQMLEAGIVALFAKEVAEKGTATLPPIETTPPLSYQRSNAAYACAQTIVGNECPFYIFGETATGRKAIGQRPPEINEHFTLRSV